MRLERNEKTPQPEVWELLFQKREMLWLINDGLIKP
jgi:hypothetical protein